MEITAWLELIGIAGGIIAIYVKLQIDLANVKKDILKLAEQLEAYKMDCSEIAKMKADRTSLIDLKDSINQLRTDIRGDILEMRGDIKILMQK